MASVICSAMKEFMPADPKEFKADQVGEAICGQPFICKWKQAVDLLYSGEWAGCLNLCNCLLAVTWEHLNVGHWKDVDPAWRYAYSYLCFFKAICEYSLLKDKSACDDVIKTLDMGLLMGAPALDDKLSAFLNWLEQQSMTGEKQVSELSNMKDSQRTTGSQACERCHNVPSDPDAMSNKFPSTCDFCVKNRSDGHVTKDAKCANPYPVIKPEHQVQCLSCPSLEYFRIHHKDPEIPVVIKGCMSHWPARSNHLWTVDYLLKLAGRRTVPVEIGSKYTDDEWGQKLMTLQEFVKKFILNPVSNTSNSKGYLAQHQLFDQIPELKNDILIPEYCCLGNTEDVDLNAWFGPEGTISPLHQDPKHNFLAQVFGDKFVRLYTIDQTALVYPNTEGILTNTSQVDVEHPDLEKFPNFAKAKPLDLILKPGEMLYIPPKCWHYVRSLAVSFSVSFWWD